MEAWAGDRRPIRFDQNHDDYTQAGNHYRLFDEGQRDHLAEAIAGPLSQAPQEVQLRQLCHFVRADSDYGRRVAAALGVPAELLCKECAAAIRSSA